MVRWFFFHSRERGLKTRVDIVLDVEQTLLMLCELSCDNAP